MRERLSIAAAKVDTPYVALIGDDEFFIPSALEEITAELDSDASLVSCIGRCAFFSRFMQRVTAWPAYSEMSGYSILADCAVDRMRYHMSHYTPSTIYAVSRVDCWRDCFQPYFEREFHAYGSAEIQFEMCNALLGKSRVLPILSWLRSQENEPIRQTDPWLDTRRGICNWWNTADEREEFAESILKVARRNGIAVSIADVISFVSEYVRQCSEPQTLVATSVLDSVKRNISSRLPRSVLKMHSVFRNREGFPLVNAPQSLGLSACGRSSLELAEIEAAVQAG